MKPTVGFTLPWAGVTSAPGDKKSRNGEDALSLSGSVKKGGSLHAIVPLLSREGVRG
jgi:hypothetical protein